VVFAAPKVASPAPPPRTLGERFFGLFRPRRDQFWK
jgi:hypothetical protein